MRRERSTPWGRLWRVPSSSGTTDTLLTYPNEKHGNETTRTFLWRYHKSAPARGRIGIFNRSHYEDVLVVRVKSLVPEEVWRERYHQINDFERNLSNDGISVLKFFLHISKDEQKRRLESCLEDPDKRWKFSSADIKERAF